MAGVYFCSNSPVFPFALARLMELQYQKYEYSAILGWSSSRYEVFSKCKRQYFYGYYGKYAPDVPHYKIVQLKGLTSVPLEIGNVVHDVMEAFLRRLQKSTSDIDEQRFFEFARQKMKTYFDGKTFIEIYYGGAAGIDTEKAFLKIHRCLSNFVSGPCYNWIFMKALTNRENWLIEPEGYGETRLNGIKAYCKMDFLFPVDGDIHILDWKTGNKDHYKHAHQLIGYAAAASSNFHISWKSIIPRIIYLFPVFDELTVPLSEKDIEKFFGLVQEQTKEMRSYCADIENNVPLPIERFTPTPSPEICGICNYREICPAVAKTQAPKTEEF
jgi:hypothetical protein